MRAGTAGFFPLIEAPADGRPQVRVSSSDCQVEKCRLSRPQHFQVAAFTRRQIEAAAFVHEVYQRLAFVQEDPYRPLRDAQVFCEALADDLSGPAVPVGPEGTLRACLPFWVIDAFFVRAADDAIDQRDTPRVEGQDKFEDFGIDG